MTRLGRATAFLSLLLIVFALSCARSSLLRCPWALPGGAPPPQQVKGPVEEGLPGYDRHRSRVMIGKVVKATRASLDLAAYRKNILLETPGPEPAEQLGRASAAREQWFGGLVTPATLTGSWRRTPLQESELAAAMAFSPLVDFLLRWNGALASPWEDVRQAVRAESFGRPPNPQWVTQEIAEVYLHQPASAPGAVPEVWVKIEFAPWAKLFSDMPDEDGDGTSEIYGMLRPGLLSSKILEVIRDDYAGRPLDAAGIKAWSHELASYWYPSFNTDLLEWGARTSFPFPDTEPAVATEMGGLVLHPPAVLMRGKPQGEALYNVFVLGDVPGQAKAKEAAAPIADPGGPREVTPRTAELKAALERELSSRGLASYEAWAAQLAPLHKEIRAKLAGRPAKLQALPGRDGYLFFRRALEAVVGGDLRKQPAPKDPLPAIVAFQRMLAKLGVDFLLVPVPSKIELYPDKLLAALPPGAFVPVLNPFGRKLVSELAAAGVEVVDLLPLLLEERKRDGTAAEPLYQPQDTHWTDRGLTLAARTIAARVRDYPWFASLASRKLALSAKEATFVREGDLVSRLAPREQSAYKPQSLIGHQVRTSEGKLYEDEDSSPITVLGDSFTGVYELLDCLGAGVSAQLARELSLPVDLVMSYGGGPSVRKKLLRRGIAALRAKRLIVWMFAARDLYNYWEDWEILGEGSAGEPSDAK